MIADRHVLITGGGTRDKHRGGEIDTDIEIDIEYCIGIDMDMDIEMIEIEF